MTDRARNPPLRTPDGRYLVVDGRLWRASNPALPEDDRQRRVGQLMDARRQLRAGSPEEAREVARAAVQAAKVALGERGPVWWTDGAPDWNRRRVESTPYAEWFTGLGLQDPAAERGGGHRLDGTDATRG